MSFICRVCGANTSVFNHCTERLDWKKPARGKKAKRIKQSKEDLAEKQRVYYKNRQEKNK